jgi:hypothetical protein
MLADDRAEAIRLGTDAASADSRVSASRTISSSP